MYWERVWLHICHKDEMWKWLQRLLLNFAIYECKSFAISVIIKTLFEENCFENLPILEIHIRMLRGCMRTMRLHL